MTEQEIRKRIEEIEDAKFNLAMKDHWSGWDFEKDREYADDLRELKAKLEEITNKPEKLVYQYGVDILIDKDGEDIYSEKVAKALEDAGFQVIGCMWNATWTEDNYCK